MMIDQDLPPEKPPWTQRAKVKMGLGPGEAFLIIELIKLFIGMFKRKPKKEEK